MARGRRAHGYQPKGEGHSEGSEEQRTNPGGEIRGGLLVYKLTGEASSGDPQHKGSEAGKHRTSLESRGLKFRAQWAAEREKVGRGRLRMWARPACSHF